VEQIQGDNLTSLAKTSHKQFSQEVVDQIYNNDIKGSSFSIKRVMMLEFSQYMENFLGHNFTTEKSSLSLLMSILVIVNESPGSACRPGLRSS
jgi:intron-binding protein aquarius